MHRLSAGEWQVIVGVEVGTSDAKVEISDAELKAIVNLEIDTTGFVCCQVGTGCDDT